VGGSSITPVIEPAILSPPSTAISQSDPFLPVEALPLTPLSLHYRELWTGLVLAVTAVSSTKDYLKTLCASATTTSSVNISAQALSSLTRASIRDRLGLVFGSTELGIHPTGPAVALTAAVCAKVCFLLPPNLSTEGKTLGDLFLTAS
jgi:hypothetical protein